MLAAVHSVRPGTKVNEEESVAATVSIDNVLTCLELKHLGGHLVLSHGPTIVGVDDVGVGTAKPETRKA